MLALPALVLLSACSKSNDTATTATTAAAGPTASAGANTDKGGPGGSAASASGATVTAKDFAFNPKDITVKAGQAVTFKDDDSAPHQPTAGTPDKPDTATFEVLIKQGQSGATPPLKAGTIPYFCQLHKTMTGVITVQ